MQRLTVSNARQQLREHGGEFMTLFEHGTLAIEFYKPVAIDKQTPHPRDEIYVVATGHGYFFNGGQRHEVEPGEVLFVPAGQEHRFEDFSDDFATWVMFYGPEGGEAHSSGKSVKNE